MILEKKFIFKRTLLDIPLMLFLISQGISTVYSIDPHVSLFGYYSRFNGGLLSAICYSLLYWAYVSNMNYKNTLSSVFSLMPSAILVSLYGIAQHFGIDKDLWVQDVQNRIFSTLGQPNWLAAWIIALIPLTWSLSLSSKIQIPSTTQIKKSNNQTYKSFQIWNLNTWKLFDYWYLVIGILFFIVLLFTKSRSGLLGFLIADIIFWLLLFIHRPTTKHVILSEAVESPKLSLRDFSRSNLKMFAICNLSFVICILAVGTPWSPSLFKLLSNSPQPTTNKQSLSLRENQQLITNSGGTESGDIRKIVWQGALDIWKANPILGTGTETFGLSYYMYRPKAHNLTSEWDFLYNKAHNEYLNTAANTGTVGLMSYILLILFSLYQIINYQSSSYKQVKGSNNQEVKQIGIFKFNDSKLFLDKQSLSLRDWNLKVGILTGYISILITNFFGFSVVPVSLLFFLFPAIAVGLQESKTMNYEIRTKPTFIQLIGITFILLPSAYCLFAVSNYYRSDLLYTKAISLSDSGNPIEAQRVFSEVLESSPSESVFWMESADTSAIIAAKALGDSDLELANLYIADTFTKSEFAISQSPNNVTYKKRFASSLLIFATYDPKYFKKAIDLLTEAIKLAPTDAKIHYNLGLAYAKNGNLKEAERIFKETIDLKNDYLNAYYGLGIALSESGNKAEAIKVYKYILENIDPNNSFAKSQLEELII